jgi:hypothetical protein
MELRRFYGDIFFRGNMVDKITFFAFVREQKSVLPPSGRSGDSYINA